MSHVITDPQSLGELVRLVRREQGLDQEELALAAGTGRRFIVDLERGKPTLQLDPTLRVLQTLGLQVEISYSTDSMADA
jgi:HTH-type transcriptional regulator / antitoxin HipB